MMQRSTFHSLPIRSLLPKLRTTLTTGVAAAALLTAALRAPAQAADAAQSAAGQQAAPIDGQIRHDVVSSDGAGLVGHMKRPP